MIIQIDHHPISSGNDEESLYIRLLPETIEDVRLLEIPFTSKLKVRKFFRVDIGTAEYGFHYAVELR